MEAQVVSIDTPIPKYIEKNIYNYNIFFNNKEFNLSINIISKEKLKFILSNRDTKNLYEYQSILSLEDFKTMNRYFKMFDSIEELANDLINIIKENNKNIEIIKVYDGKILINIKIIARNENNVTISLEKVEIKNKDKINNLFTLFERLKNDLQVKDKKIMELESKISLINENNKKFEKKMLEELDKRDQKIKLLEEQLNLLKNNVNTNSKEEENNPQSILIKTDNIIDNNNINNIDNNINFENILMNSNIFQDDDEILLLLNNIPYSHNNLNLIYSSKLDGENEEKLLNSYIGKNDIIILVKTDRLRRFGGYIHECFERNKFKKKDNKAFLFNLNKKTIYRSKGGDYSIWRGVNTFDSINFGNGVDLKIYHKFLNKQSNTHQGHNDYDYKDEDYALNGDQTFNISSLEIYQVFLSKK